MVEAKAVLNDEVSAPVLAVAGFSICKEPTPAYLFVVTLVILVAPSRDQPLVFTSKPGLVR